MKYLVTHLNSSFPDQLLKRMQDCAKDKIEVREERRLMKSKELANIYNSPMNQYRKRQQEKRDGKPIAGKEEESI
jgi:tRNA A37 N6-isopentenylltransferase MiaA